MPHSIKVTCDQENATSSSAAIFWDLTQRRLAAITDVSERTVASFFTGQSVQEWTAGPSKDGAHSLFQNISNKLPTYTTDSAHLMYTAEESSK
jgi:hypothetical protein